MNDKIDKRVMDEAYHIIETGDTIREIAKKYGVSKSTIHKDLNDRLFNINKQLYKEVEKILKYHINIRHIRGGESTRKKYLKTVWITYSKPLFPCYNNIKNKGLFVSQLKLQTNKILITILYFNI